MGNNKVEHIAEYKKNMFHGGVIFLVNLMYSQTSIYFMELFTYFFSSQMWRGFSH